MNLKEILGEELYNQVLEKVGKENELLLNNKKENTYVPKSRLDSVIGQKKVLSDKVDDLEIKLQEMQGDMTNVETLKTQLKTAQDDITTAKKEVEVIKKEAEIKLAITESGAKKKDVISKLLDLDKIKIKEDGTIEGLKEQIEAIKTDVPELFVSAQPNPNPNPAPTGDDGKGTDPQPPNPQGGTGSPGKGGPTGGGKPESIGAKLAKKRASAVPEIDYFK